MTHLSPSLDLEIESMLTCRANELLLTCDWLRTLVKADQSATRFGSVQDYYNLQSDSSENIDQTLTGMYPIHLNFNSHNNLTFTLATSILRMMLDTTKPNEHTSSRCIIGKHIKKQHGIEKPSIAHNFTVLRKWRFTNAAHKITKTIPQRAVGLDSREDFYWCLSLCITSSRQTRMYPLPSFKYHLHNNYSILFTSVLHFLTIGSDHFIQ